MSTSVIPDLIARLVTTFDSALPADVLVVDGDIVTGEPGTTLMVGWDDPDNERATSATSNQEWAGIGAKARNEDGEITCLVVALDGNSVMATARATAKAVTDAVENALRADPNLGGAVPGLMWVSYGTRTEVRQWLSDQGAVCSITFEIAFKARI